MESMNPAILTWARETAGLSLEEGSQAIGLNPAHGRSGFERLAALEKGDDLPSRKLLLNMAKAYRRSLLVFYLSEPPKTADRGQDFRTVPGAKPQEYSGDLDALLRDIKARQNIVKSLLEDTDADKIGFVASATMEIPVTELAEKIVRQIGFSLQEFRAQKTPDQAFAYLRNVIESAGVFVLLVGNLGTHHTNISSETFRGFAISDPLAPFVVVNDQDARISWPFTMLHELVHIWLGTTGISGQQASTKIEQYCNDVASEILLPVSEISQFSSISVEAALSTISAMALRWNLSRAMVAYKLYKSGFMSAKLWDSLDAKLKQEWQDLKGKFKEKPKTLGGPDYYVVRRNRLGHALVGLIQRSLSDGLITYTKAGQVLGVKPRNVDPLLRTKIAIGI